MRTRTDARPLRQGLRGARLWSLLALGLWASGWTGSAGVAQAQGNPPAGGTAGGVPAPRFKLGGGAATFLHFEHSRERSEFSDTRYTRKTLQTKNLVYNIYWLDVNVETDEAVSFTGRVSNVNATKLWRWTMDGEPQDDIAWMCFQYAYMTWKIRPAEVRLGYLAVDRANEPLEAHVTPDRTAWTPYAAATMGSMRGASVRVPLVGKLVDPALPPHLRPAALSVAADLTTAINTDGSGLTVIKQESLDPPETRKYNWPSLDVILRFPVSGRAASIEPLLAFRSHADADLESNPGNGRGDWRVSYGFTGNYTFSRRVSSRCGVGFSRFSNDNTRNQFVGTRVVGDQVADVYSAVKDNATMYVTLRPQVLVGTGALIGDVKYSSFEDRSPRRAFRTDYVNASIMYFARVRERLMIMPTLRLYSQSYENPNEQARVDFRKVRICPQLLMALTF